VNRYFGTPLLEFRNAAVSAAEHAYQARQCIESHEHDQAYICVVISGSYRESSELGERDCRSGDVLIHPAGTMHSDTFGPVESRLLMIAADREQFPRPAIFDEGPACAIGARIHDEIAAPDDVTGVAVEGLLLELSAVAHRANGSSSLPGWLRRARERIEDLLPRRCTIRELAQEADVHPAHFAREFRAHHGRTVAEFIRERRVMLARSAIVRGESLVDAAASAGFADQSELTRAFRRVTGTTPSRFRRTL
jgi:AraC family transcriptional regulator